MRSLQSKTSSLSRNVVKINPLLFAYTFVVVVVCWFCFDSHEKCDHVQPNPNPLTLIFYTHTHISMMRIRALTPKNLLPD